MRSTIKSLFKDVMKSISEGRIDLDSVMALATSAMPKKDIDAQHLAKIWQIDLESAQKTFDVTTQHKVHTPNPKLTRNYSTNDHMLRYKHINEHFFMDTFFATKKSGKSSRGHM
jgi:hypothetical protein